MRTSFAVSFLLLAPWASAAPQAPEGWQAETEASKGFSGPLKGALLISQDLGGGEKAFSVLSSTGAPLLDDVNPGALPRGRAAHGVGSYVLTLLPDSLGPESAHYYAVLQRKTLRSQFTGRIVAPLRVASVMTPPLGLLNVVPLEDDVVLGDALRRFHGFTADEAKTVLSRVGAKRRGAPYTVTMASKVRVSIVVGGREYWVWPESVDPP